MTIAKRLLLFIGVQLLLLAGLALYGWRQFAVIEERSSFLATNVTPSLAILGHLGHDLIEYRAETQLAIGAANGQAASTGSTQFDPGADDTRRLIDTYRKDFIAEPAEMPYLESYARSFEEFQKIARQAVALSRTAGADAAYKFFRDEAHPAESKLLADLDAWTRYNEQLANSLRADALHAIRDARRNLLLTGIGVILASAWLGRLIQKQILRPVQTLQSTVRTIAFGDYNTPVPFTQRNDETGSLAQSIEVLRKVASDTETDRWVKMRLGHLITDLQAAADVAQFGRILREAFAHDFHLELQLVPADVLPTSSNAPTPADEVERILQRLHLSCLETRRSAAATSGELSLAATPLLVGSNLVGVLHLRETPRTDPRAHLLLAELYRPVALVLESLERRLALERQTGELERQQTLLRQTEAWFRQVIENAPEGLVVSDGEGRIVFSNRETTRIFGYAPEELVGLQVERLLPPHQRETHARHRADLPAHSATSAPLSISGFALRKDGTRFPVETELSRLTPVPGRAGEYCIVVRDITERRKAEVEMAQLSRAVEQTSSIVVITDLDGNIEYVNPQFTRVTGYTFEEVRGKSTRLLKSGLTPPQVYAELWGTICAGQVWRGELVNRKKSGELYPESLVISPITDSQGKATHYVAIKEDITVRKQNERRILFNRFVVENSGPMLWLDPRDAQCVYVNQAALAHFGYTAPEFLHLGVAEWNPGFTPLHVAELAASLRASGRPLTHRSRHRRKDGTFAEVEANLFLAEDTERSVLVVSFQDITDRVRAEQAIQQQRAQLQRILDTAPVGVAISVDGIIRFSNPRMVELLGLEEGVDDAKIYTDPSARGLIREAVQRNGTVRDLQLRLRRPNGETIEVLGTYMSTEFDGKTGLLGWLVDVSSLKAAEAEIFRAKEIAEAATRAKSDFLANMSHEIRTPMNAIIGLTHLALRHAQEPRQRRYLEKVGESADHLLSLVNDILDFSKIEAGKLVLEKIEFKFEDILAAVSDFIGVRVAEKRLEFLFRLQPNLPPVLIGDPLRLKQILLNLASNAAKFTEHGHLVVGAETVSRTADSLVLHCWVSDTGIGLTESQLTQLFQSFTQGDSSTTRRYGGSGLGLAICRRLVELMDGRIWAESTPNVGSTFHFEVRLGLPTHAPARRMPDATAFRGRRLLLADDNPAAREILAEMTREIGLEVDVVADGTAALAQLEQALASGTPYRLALLDTAMPGLDGPACFTRYLHQAGAAQTTAIFLTTAGTPEPALGDDAAGALTLAKPITPSALFEAIGSALADATPAPRARAAQVPATDRPLEGLTLLLAEDNALNLELALELLESAGAKVLVARDGREAVELAQSDTHFDAVLMDCQMPVLDGYDAAREIHALPPRAKLPIIALTANVLAADLERARDAGMQDHIPKPIDIARLISTVLRWTRGADAARVVTAQPAALPPAPLGRLPEIDQSVGLRCCDGNTTLYRRLLLSYRTENLRFAERFAAARANGDLALAERLAHTLKSTSGTLGALAVQRAATELDAAIRASAPAPQLDELAARVTAALAPVLTGLAELALGPSDQAPTQLDRAAALAQLDEIAALLNRHDPRANTVAEALAQATRGTALAGDVARLHDVLSAYEFDEAITLVATLRSSLASPSAS